MNTKSISIALMAFLFLPFITLGQQELTLEKAVMGRWGNLSPERLSNVSWIPNTDNYTYVEKSESGQTLVMVNASDFEKNEIISLAELGSKTLVKKAMNRFPRFTWINESEARFVYTKVVFTFNRKNQKVTRLYALPKGGSNFEFAPNSFNMAFTRENNVFAIIDAQEVQITNHENPNIVAGQLVSRQEFGINKGLFWSNDGKQIAFYEKDETSVTSYPLVDYTTTPASLSPTKYPMAGMGSEEVKVGIYNISSTSSLYLNTEGTKEQYLTGLSWGPRGKFFYVGHLNRDQNDYAMKQYDPVSGEAVQTIFTEKDKEYVHPMTSFHFTTKEDAIWQSEKSGLNQMYWYNISGGANWQINTQDILVRSFINYNAKTKTITFLGNHKDKIDQHLYSVKIIDGGNEEPKQLTKGDIYYSYASSNYNGSYAIVAGSSLSAPRTYDLVEIKNAAVSNLFTADNPLVDYNVGKTEMGTIKAADGNTILHQRIIYPFDFDEAKKYPVLIYVYNGPGVQLLHSSWLGSAPLWMYEFANRGYIVYTLDGRGSTNRGIEFEQSTFRKLGQVEMLDQLQGVEYLKSLPFIDGNRLAIHGWSYGGYMTTALLTSYPGVFKVGVAGGPVMDWKFYEVMYTERYMDTPETNADGFKLTSNVERAKELKDPLLIIHGTSDPTVVKQHSDAFLKKCIENGIRVDYFEYPGHEHNVYGKDRVHLMDKVLHYIESNL